jgi:hypothetical protein
MTFLFCSELGIVWNPEALKRMESLPVGEQKVDLNAGFKIVGLYRC